jgi:hypothetical protein
VILRKRHVARTGSSRFGRWATITPENGVAGRGASRVSFLAFLSIVSTRGEVADQEEGRSSLLAIR